MWQVPRVKQGRRFGSAAALPALSLVLFQCCSSGPGGWARWSKRGGQKWRKIRNFINCLQISAVTVTGSKPISYFFNLRVLPGRTKKKKLNKSGLIFCNCSGRRFIAANSPGSDCSLVPVLHRWARRMACSSRESGYLFLSILPRGEAAKEEPG